MQNEQTKKTKSAPRLLIILVTAVLVGIVSFFVVRPQNKSSVLEVNNRKITVEVAITKNEQEHGLCCRDSLPSDSGMLFVYNKPGIYRFWMKDTRIPLDMYWIDAQKKVIYIEQNVQSNTYPRSFGPYQPAQYILETNAGYARKHNISVGDIVSF